MDDFAMDVGEVEKLLAEYTKTMSSHTSKKQRLLGAPFDFVADVCLLTEGRAALVVALYIFHRTVVESSRTVTLPGRDLTQLGVGRSNKQKALIQLKAARLIAVKTSNGRTAEVTLRWKRGRADRRL